MEGYDDNLIELVSEYESNSDLQEELALAQFIIEQEMFEQQLTNDINGVV